MAQQIALRIWSERRQCRHRRIPPNLPPRNHEEKAYQALHGLRGRLVGNARRVISLSDLEGIHEPLAARC